MSDTLIGKKLGDYLIQEILGRGGMAHVYRGYDPNLQRFAAVKVIDSRLLSKGHEEEYRARFRREARAIARLTHPNIVGVYQFGEFGPLYYMAMEFIDGRDLGITLKQNAQTGIRLTPRQIVRIIHDIAGALDYAHAGNVIHRDVKPSNIMVTSDERAVLTDFGLALDVPEGTGGNTFGSAHYIAPEQAISSRNAVPQSDLYSLGVVLYQMVTGRVPFDDNSAMSVALKHLSDPPPPPRMVDPTISIAVEKVILKALEKEPSKRYKNGEVMARALEEALETTPIDLSDSQMSGSRPSRPTLSSSTNPKRSTREMEAIGSQTIQFADQDVSEARKAILRAKTPDRSQPLLTAIGLTIIALLLLGIFAIIRMGNNPPPPVPTAVVAAASPTDVAVLIENTATQTDVPNPTDTDVIEATSAAVGVDAASPSPDASATPSETTPPTETTAPTDTDTAEPTATSVATDTDVPTTTTVVALPTRRASPTRRPTRTPAPTDTATLVDTATSSPDGSSGGAVVNPDAPLVLIYDDDQLVLLNRSERSANISGLVFMQRTANGLITFEAASWSTDLIRSIPAGDCLMLWRIGTREAPTPDYCHERQAWFAVGTPRRFWLNADSDATFDVFNFGIVVATCPVNSGECGLET